MSFQPSMSPVLTEDFSAAIGRVVVNFSLLESAVGEAVAGLAHGSTIGPDDIWPPRDLGGDDAQIVGEILTSGSSFRRNVEMFACLQRLRNPAHDEVAFKELVKTLFNLEAERNKIVHSFWSGGEDGTAERHKVTSRSDGHRVQKEQVPLLALHDLAETIGIACSRLLPYMFGGQPHSVATCMLSEDRQ